MPTLIRFALVGLLGGAACGSPRAAQVPPIPLVDPGTLQPGADRSDVKIDGGRLEFAHDGVAIGAEGFELRRQGDRIVLETDVEMDLFGQNVRGHAELIMDTGYRPLSGTSSHLINGVQVNGVMSGGPDSLTMTVTSNSASDPGEPHVKNERAPGPVDLYASDTGFANFAPLCVDTVADRNRVTAFPGVVMTIGEVKTHGAVRTLPIDFGGALQVDIHCDGAQLLGVDIPLVGLTTTREGSLDELASARRPPRAKPAVPTGLIELDRTVQVSSKGVEPATLACSLLVPMSHADVKLRSRKGPAAALPAAVFVTGSGLQDRDEDSYGPGGLKLAIFKVIAIELGRAGIASLRCDDRGSGKSIGSLDNATLQTFVADATAVVAAARREFAIDPSKIAMIGHSEGGNIAPLVATRDPKLRAIVLMAGTGRGFDVVMLEQLRRGLERAGKPADEIEAELTRSRAIMAAIADGTPMPDGISDLEAKQWASSRAWMASHLKHDPAQTAARLGKIAVLIAQGDADRQVAVADAEALAAGFAKAKNRRVQTKIYPGLNHLFARSTRGDLSEYSDPDARVDEQFLADVVTFVVAAL